MLLKLAVDRPHQFRRFLRDEAATVFKVRSPMVGPLVRFLRVCTGQSIFIHRRVGMKYYVQAPPVAGQATDGPYGPGELVELPLWAVDFLDQTMSGAKGELMTGAQLGRLFDTVLTRWALLAVRGRPVDTILSRFDT